MAGTYDNLADRAKTAGRTPENVQDDPDLLDLVCVRPGFDLAYDVDVYEFMDVS